MTNLFKKKFIKVPHLSIRSFLIEIGRNAYVDWILILGISALVSLCLVIGGVFLYWQISTGNYKTKSEIKPLEKKVIDVKGLNAITARFNSRKDAFEQAKKVYSGYADPSK